MENNSQKANSRPKAQKYTLISDPNDPDAIITYRVTPVVHDALAEFFARLGIQEVERVLSTKVFSQAFTQVEVEMKRELLFQFFHNVLLATDIQLHGENRFVGPSTRGQNHHFEYEAPLVEGEGGEVPDDEDFDLQALRAETELFEDEPDAE